jgi:death-on-curing protein
MEYLTPAQVLFIHARLIAETGGSPGVRDLGQLEAALARPRATFEGELLYTDLPAQAAALMESLVRNHPFVDGNKRVGITAAALFLRRNGLRLTAASDEVEAFTLRVARGEAPLEEMTQWFRTHATPIPEDG